MTPATTIALNLAAQAEKMGLVVEQAEDEIAAGEHGRGRGLCWSAQPGPHFRRRLRPHGRRRQPGGHDRNPAGDRRGAAARAGHRPAHAHRTGRPGIRAPRRTRRISPGRACSGKRRRMLSLDPAGPFIWPKNINRRSLSCPTSFCPIRTGLWNRSTWKAASRSTRAGPRPKSILRTSGTP